MIRSSSKYIQIVKINKIEYPINDSTKLVDGLTKFITPKAKVKLWPKVKPVIAIASNRFLLLSRIIPRRKAIWS